ncbi:dihydropteroate synthase [Desulfoprunum benzoelyticum]|nr:dihydropteroate synthase [Desulfoprunum benzoelyticum]MBM9530611.1 dihydropteroate synthase [Desulfoprunum benzoelyticum]
MGILNVTPDSFSDGGSFYSFDLAVAHAENLIADGADIIDIGGESTRPFAKPVSLDNELQRTIPIIEAIRRRHRIPISIDTVKAEVARRALAAGADIINDISALRHDPDMLDVVQNSTAAVIVMHMQGTPADMQVNPVYDNVVGDLLKFFQERIDWLTASGVDRDRLILDPGIGFGKTADHNLSILKHLSRFTALGLPVLLAHSRKRFLGELTGLAASQRDQLTAVVSALSVNHGISYLRVHDVASTRLAVRLAEAIAQAE